jgi:uncharacterized protein GlcG (DUF336 family)
MPACMQACGLTATFMALDGSGLMGPGIAAGKAWGILGLGFGTRNLAERAESLPQFFGALADLVDGGCCPTRGNG